MQSMNKEIDNIFIEAEKLGQAEIQETFDRLFEKYSGNIKKMSELSVVLDNRLKNSLDNKGLYVFYSMLQSEIFERCDSLNSSDYKEFCRLSGYSSIVKEKLSR